MQRGVSYQIICILLEPDRDIWGYGLFDFSDCSYVERTEKDVIELCKHNKIRNAKVQQEEKSGVKIEKLKLLDDLNLMPTFFTDHKQAYSKQSLYVICTCRKNGVDGYLLLLPDGTLAFFTIWELRELMKTNTITNIKLKKYRRLKGKHPIPVGIAFKYIGNIDFV